MYPIPTEVITITSVLVSSIIGPFIVEYFKKKWDKKIDPVHESIQTNVLIEDKVESIKEEFKADRVWIFQFHNGGQFYPSGKSMKKFSMFYETLSDNTSSIQNQFQNIPISLFSKSLNELYNNDIISISDYSDSTIENFGLKYIAEENKNKSGYLFAIKSIEGKFIGVLGISYTQEITSLTQQKISHLANEATAIGGVLLNTVKK